METAPRRRLVRSCPFSWSYRLGASPIFPTLHGSNFPFIGCAVESKKIGNWSAKALRHDLQLFE